MGRVRASQPQSDAQGSPAAPFLDDADLQVWLGDAVESLRQLPDASVQCCVTSPPFFGLRDYGTGTWVGGDPECQHSVGGQVADSKAPGAITAGVRPGVDAWTCRKCEATRQDQQIGLEGSLEQWVAALVAVFREVRRVMRPDGTLWLELADSYNSGTNAVRKGSPSSTHGNWERGGAMGDQRINAAGLKPKDLMGAPFEVVFALRADGWWWRQTIIWHKRNAMPESAKDRPTTAHSYVFLMSPSARYYYDDDAIAEPAEWSRWGDQTNPKYDTVGEANASWIKGLTKEQIDRKFGGGRQRGAGQGGYKTTDERNERFQGSVELNPDDDLLLFDHEGGEPGEQGNGKQRTADGTPAGTVRREQWKEAGGLTRRSRSVWSLSTEPNRLAVCSVCEAFWDGDHPDQHCGADVVEHFAAFPRELARRAILAGSRRGDVVLDPFGGSGTTAMAARELGRKAVLIELRREYAVMIRERTRQQSLLAT